MLLVHFNVKFDPSGLGAQLSIQSPFLPLSEDKFVELVEVWLNAMKAEKKKNEEVVSRLKGEGRLVSMGEWKKENL